MFKTISQSTRQLKVLHQQLIRLVAIKSLHQWPTRRLRSFSSRLAASTTFSKPCNSRIFKIHNCRGRNNLWFPCRKNARSCTKSHQSKTLLSNGFPVMMCPDVATTSWSINLSRELLAPVANKSMLTSTKAWIWHSRSPLLTISKFRRAKKIRRAGRKNSFKISFKSTKMESCLTNRSLPTRNISTNTWQASPARSSTNRPHKSRVPMPLS